MKKITVLLTLLAFAFIPSITLSKEPLSKYAVRKVSIGMSLEDVLLLYPEFTLSEGDEVVRLSLKKDGNVVARADFSPAGKLRKIEAYFPEEKIFNVFGVSKFDDKVDRALNMKKNVMAYFDVMYDLAKVDPQWVIEGNEKGDIFFRSARFESTEVVLTITLVEGVAVQGRRYVVRLQDNSSKEFVAKNVNLD